MRQLTGSAHNGCRRYDFKLPMRQLTTMHTSAGCLLNFKLPMRQLTVILQQKNQIKQ